MAEKKKAPGAAPGSNNGGGRKANERKIVRANRMIFEDQMGASSEFIRAAIDAARGIKSDNNLNIEEK